MSSVAGGDGDDEGGLALCGGSVTAYVSVNDSISLSNQMTNPDLTTRLEGGTQKSDFKIGTDSGETLTKRTQGSLTYPPNASKGKSHRPHLSRPRSIIPGRISSIELVKGVEKLVGGSSSNVRKVRRDIDSLFFQ